jgi:hypothetical protein
VPIIYTGPYSFEAAPVERAFALLKHRIKEELATVDEEEGITIRGGKWRSVVFMR